MQTKKNSPLSRPTCHKVLGGLTSEKCSSDTVIICGGDLVELIRTGSSVVGQVQCVAIGSNLGPQLIDSWASVRWSVTYTLMN